MIRYTDGIKQFRAGMNEPAAASALWLDNMNIDEQLWWGRLFMLSNTQAAAARAGWSPRLIHTDVAWPCVATVTHGHQHLQHLMNIK